MQPARAEQFDQLGKMPILPLAAQNFVTDDQRAELHARLSLSRCASPKWMNAFTPLACNDNDPAGGTASKLEYDVTTPGDYFIACLTPG